MNHLLEHISLKINSPIKNWTALAGGDISNVYLLETKEQQFVLKTNATQNALAMFQAEQAGLEAIAATKTIQTPEVFLVESLQGTAFLLMEYVETKRPDRTDFERLGQDLGQLHQVNQSSFGFPKDNFIGSLPQSNTSHDTWLDFYISERLLPQLFLARQLHLLSNNDIPSTTDFFQKGQALFQNIQSRLLHGDLWSGNYLIATDGTPYLIDPATYFGHAEVDIAMTRLFGGFGAAFYNAYYEVHPRQKETAIRQNWYQLYYLLVHLNLFGKGYYGQVKRILDDLFVS